MTVEEDTVVQTPVTEPVAQTPLAQAPVVQTPVAETVVSSTRTPGPSGGELTRRIVVFLFGLIQGLIVLRIVFLLLDARESNGLVSGILDLSQVFVAPFDGILHTNALQAGGAILDIAAIVALIGWTILEFLVIAGIGVFRREPA